MTKPSKERYFDLRTQDQADLLRGLAPIMGRRAEILEKDIWLCQVLDLLFRLPCCKPMAFKGARTFWEKATLIHVECHRPALRASAERLSRHWYDLAKLADHPVGQEAIRNRAMLDAQMFYDETPSFEQITERLRVLEKSINTV